MLPFFIARRHLISRKSHSVINLIAGVSVISVAVPVMALIIILSFHNGLGDFIKKMYSDFDSEIRITPRQGQIFQATTDFKQQLEALPEVEAVSATAEQNVLITYSDRQSIAIMRGVDSTYQKVVHLDRRIVQGKYQLKLGDLDRAIVGQGVAYTLGINTMLLEPLQIYAIRTDGGGGPSFLPLSIYRTARIAPMGIYSLDEQTDSRYVFVPLDFAQQLLGYGQKISSLEIKLKAGISLEQGKRAIETVVESEHFYIKTRFEQKETMYRMVEQEKWIIYLLLMFVVLIAALSLVGSVVMLATDKERDQQMLLAMGGTPRLLRRIFTWEGALISACGVGIGLLLGGGFSLLQQEVGIIKVAGEAFLIDAYPVRIELFDLFVVTGGVLLLGTIVSALTSAAITKQK